MTVSSRTEKILWSKSGSRCSFPGCRRKLVADATQLDDNVVLGEIAHIVARTRNGPRGQLNFPGGDVDAYDNLILLCDEHHKLIDGQPNTYTVEKLVQIKKDHEYWVNEQLSREERFQQAYTSPKELVKETIYSTLLPVNVIPRFVYLSPCSLQECEIGDKIASPRPREVMLPFIIRAGKLITFLNLRDEKNPFCKVIDIKASYREDSATWWEDPDLYRWYVTLLNRSLNKLTGRKNLNLDKEHSRYYFGPRKDGVPQSVTYRSLEGRRTSMMVAWRPKFRYKDEFKNYWEHLAVALRFHRLAQSGWCLSIRPERRFTRDGYSPLTPKGIGRRSTSRKARMYNINLLKEVHFWRDYLSGGSPRIIFKFGSQNIVVDTEMMNAQISWPGVPEDSKPFRNVRYSDDLFTSAEYQATLQGEIDDFGEWKEEETATERDERIG